MPVSGSLAPRLRQIVGVDEQTPGALEDVAAGRREKDFAVASLEHLHAESGLGLGHLRIERRLEDAAPLDDIRIAGGIDAHLRR